MHKTTQRQLHFAEARKPPSTSTSTKRSPRTTRPRWRGLSRRAIAGILILVILLGAFRIALPAILKGYVNRKLQEVPEYSGRIGDVDVALYRGAYTIHDVEILKANGEVATPFFSARKMDLSVQWKELFHGAVVGEIQLQEPAVAFVAGPTEEESQTGMNKDWRKMVEKLFPFQINRVAIDKGKIRFQAPHRTPKVDISIYDLSANATNLTNVRDLTNALPASVAATAKVWGEGELEVNLAINPLAEYPTFKLAAVLTNIDLVALNDFMQAYGKVDVAKGTLSLFIEIGAADGKYDGYIKPFFRDLDIYAWDQERKDNFLRAFWEAIAGTVATVFKNHPHDQLATRIPISGTFDQSNVDLWATVGNLLRNAFVRALLPTFDRTVRFSDVHPEKDRVN